VCDCVGGCVVERVRQCVGYIVGKPIGGSHGRCDGEGTSEYVGNRVGGRRADACGCWGVIGVGDCDVGDTFGDNVGNFMAGVRLVAVSVPSLPEIRPITATVIALWGIWSAIASVGMKSTEPKPNYSGT
jgi:hypothetical protein